MAFDPSALARFGDQAPHAMAMFDRMILYIAASPRWLADYRLEQARLGRSRYEVFREIGDAWKAVHQRCLGGTTESSDCEPFERADGAVQWIRWVALVVVETGEIAAGDAAPFWLSDDRPVWRSFKKSEKRAEKFVSGKRFAPRCEGLSRRRAAFCWSTGFVIACMRGRRRSAALRADAK